MNSANSAAWHVNLTTDAISVLEVFDEDALVKKLCHAGHTNLLTKHPSVEDYFWLDGSLIVEPIYISTGYGLREPNGVYVQLPISMDLLNGFVRDGVGKHQIVLVKN